MKEEIFSIKDLENFTQIKAHTIRIWEQRYKLLEPKRTDTNIRYYDKEDLKKILNINLLYTSGMKISKIAALSSQEIIDKCTQLLNKSENKANKEIEEYILQLIDFNHNEIRRLLDKSVEIHGLDKIFSEILNPLLIRMGEFWQVNTLDIVHEHFLSGLVREFLINRISEARPNRIINKKAVFFLHENELHEFSLLFYHLIFKLQGYDCYYLGQTLPISELKGFVEKVNPDVFITSFVSQLSEKEFVNILDTLLTIVDQKDLIISGHQAVNYQDKVPKTIVIIQSEKDLKNIFV